MTIADFLDKHFDAIAGVLLSAGFWIFAIAVIRLRWGNK